MILTYKYRIKDSTSRRKLERLSSTVNFVWNYINDLSYRNIKFYSRFLSDYDIDKYLTGSSKELGLHSTTLQEVSKVYVANRTTFKKRKLSWRSHKRKSLGWIPFKSSGIKFLTPDSVKYKDLILRFYKSRPIPQDAIIKSGSFSQDSRNRWYLNLIIDIPSNSSHINSDSKVGIDLGIKNTITLSDGQVFNRENITKKYQNKLATAQKANKKRQVKNISAKIKNTRLDWAHKTTTQIAKQFADIYVGNLKTNDIITENNNINKAIYDVGIYQIKTFLEYKAIKLGGKSYLIEEYYTTQTCSSCQNLTGPTGEKDLNIREWTCKSCNVEHNRDINSAKNILRIGHYTL